jgi:hypothetical protein
MSFMMNATTPMARGMKPAAKLISERVPGGPPKVAGHGDSHDTQCDRHARIAHFIQGFVPKSLVVDGADVHIRSR